ncbi:MAG: tRNA uridine-5-carboxymethylaminomethyl(34) synthesis GTPase MnmE [Firmicutes bacterium]|nr:tRNA uridine-5-carboxymethylaminomethyl(34) synthesis GTPase MnmE [Bacillota bacterium]
MNNSAIAAIATAPGTAGIGIIRISGDDAPQIAKQVFSKPIIENRKMVYGSILHGDKVIDRGLACYFKAPNSYTGEDIIELFCHGGIVVCKMALESVLSCGAVLAQPGEFTRRAFLNGRMDLAQAEAVGDLIDAKTESAVFAATNQLDGKLSKKVSDIRSKIMDITAHLAATFDFSDEIEPILSEDLLSVLETVKIDIDALLSTADDGLLIKDGINAAIVGAPNVGKSSFLNLLAGEDRAIVTDIEGTTRDVLEIGVNIRGCRLNLLDTAGIRKSPDVIEQLGVERSVGAIEKADIVFLVVDGSRELNALDKRVISLIDGKNTICIINKCDLPKKITAVPFENKFEISALTGLGLDELLSFIFQKYSKGHLSAKVLITNNRHKEALIYSKKFINSAISSTTKGLPADIILSDLELSLTALGEIDGMSVGDEILENIFSRFCIGK